MIKNNNWELLIKYFEGDCNETEKKEIQQLLKSENEFKSNFEQLKILWETPETQLPIPDTEKAWLQVKERINRVKLKQLAENKNKNIIQWWTNSNLLKIAALLLIVLTSAYFIFQSNLDNKIQFNEIIVAQTQIEKINLPDGSQIILDSGSSFKYPQNFADNSRDVYLNGEAYFQVTKDEKKPFIVHAAYSEIKVLGTEFNVRAWSNCEKIIVAVKEGMVALKSVRTDSSKNEVLIAKNQFSELLKNASPALPQETDISAYLQWQNKEMYFQNVPLKEVLDQLKRWYNLDIEILDKSITLNRVTIFLENEKIDEILDVISLMNNMRYDKNGLNVVFYSNK